MSLLALAAVTFLSLCPSPVSSHPASPLAVAVAVQQFSNAKIVPDVLPKFNPTGLMTFNFTGNNLKTQIGDSLNETLVATKPQGVYIHGTAAAEATSGGPYNVTTHKYTVVLFDAGTPGFNSTSGYNLHWLSNDWTYGENDDHTVFLNPPDSLVVDYAAPAPPSGSGPHRYIGLIWAQPDNFSAPAQPTQGSGVTLFNVTQYAQKAGFADAICGTYFTVQVGTATVSVASTTAVDSTTLPQFTPTSSTSSAAASVTSQQPNAAIGLGGAGKEVGAGILVLLGAVLSGL